MISGAPVSVGSIVLAFLLAFGIAVLAWRARALSASGAVAATTVGTAAMASGWRWGAFLLVWFGLTTLLSRIGRWKKHERTATILEKSDRRDARQVLANGGVFALLAALLAALGGPSIAAAADDLPRLLCAIGAVGALTAAGADTWATELGTLGGGSPWSLREGRQVPAGTSGAISLAGSLAMLAGALLLAALAVLLDVVPRAAWGAIALGGVAGAVLDTLVGAWGQERRWCPDCRSSTEQRVHACGARTARRGGMAALDNDAVNLLCTVAGALVAVLVWRVSSQ